jgi:hypothetical protein
MRRERCAAKAKPLAPGLIGPDAITGARPNMGISRRIEDHHAA